jgi:predicted O-methyltransferase YrrM
MSTKIDMPAVSVKDLHTRLGFPNPIDYPESSLSKPFTDWKMETDDAPIFRYLYRNFRPQRHLEFGTWQGTGVLCCLEECDATVWTVNLLKGEEQSNKTWIYGNDISLYKYLPHWSKRLPLWIKRKIYGEDVLLSYQTDTLGQIGKYYIEKGLGNRVCQIYSDSRQWDISNYPEGFFDSVLIDGGHTQEIVMNDTQKALKLLRSGGIVMWHDFCPTDEVYNNCSSTHGVLHYIQTEWNSVASQMKDIFWIKPSWILLGVKK